MFFAPLVCVPTVGSSAHPQSARRISFPFFLRDYFHKFPLFSGRLLMSLTFAAGSSQWLTNATRARVPTRYISTH